MTPYWEGFLTGGALMAVSLIALFVLACAIASRHDRSERIGRGAPGGEPALDTPDEWEGR